MDKEFFKITELKNVKQIRKVKYNMYPASYSKNRFTAFRPQRIKGHEVVDDDFSYAEICLTRLPVATHQETHDVIAGLRDIQSYIKAIPTTRQWLYDGAEGGKFELFYSKPPRVPLEIDMAMRALCDRVDRMSARYADVRGIVLPLLAKAREEITSGPIMSVRPMDWPADHPLPAVGAE